MIEVLSAENMRQSDADTIASGVPGRELMLRAGRGIVEAAEEVCGWESPCAIVCGSGNNGGDGYVIAQLLAKKGIDCRIFLMKERFTADGAFYFEGCRQMGIPSALCTQETDFTGYRRIVDCIFGTGLSGPAEGLAAKVIGKINAAGRTGSVVISADINSGLNADNGQGEPCVQSDLTVAVGGWKYGHFLGSAMDVMKEKRSCGIGIRPSRRPAYLVEAADVRACFPERRHESNKGSFGYLALIGGSIRYSGSIRLANLANAAVRSGAGVVKLAIPRGICTGIMPHILESTLFALSEREDGGFRFVPKEWEELLRGTRAAAFGMGVGFSEDTVKAAAWLLGNYGGTLILDADGLNALAALLKSDERILQNARCKVVLTPHLKEFSRLSGESIERIRREPVALAETFAGRNRLVLLLKGPCTIVTDGERTLFCDRGCPGMAGAGSGDVLSGIISAVCAANPDRLLEGAAAAAYINGAAGELAQQRYNAVTMAAGDTAACVRDVMVELLKDDNRIERKG